MKRSLLSAALCALLTLGLHAAQAPTPTSRASEVPRLLRYSGSVAGVPGAPRAGAVGVVFAIYAEPTGGAPLWVETQNVQLDAQGRYAVNLGAVNALPNSIFATNEARWLGVQVLADAAAEQPRIMLVSVPYALKAQDAETLGGRPASAYLLADAATAPNGTRPATRKGTAAALEVEGAVNADEPHTVNAIPKFSATNTLDDSLMFETYNQAAFDAFGLVIPGNEDVVNIGDGSGLRKRLNVTGRVTAEAFDINTSTLANSFRVVNDHPDARAMQANARDGGHGFTTGLFASARSNNAAGITAYAYEPDVPNTGDEYAAGVFAGNYNPAGPGVVAWSAYNGTVSGDDYPIVTDPVGLYAAVAHSTGIAAVLDYRNTGTGQLLSARNNGAEVASMNTDGDLATSGDITATGTITATGGFSGSGAGLTGITASSITNGTLTVAKLAFDPATQAELDAHKTSGDHDSRYARTATSNSFSGNQSITGALSATGAFSAASAAIGGLVSAGGLELPPTSGTLTCPPNCSGSSSSHLLDLVAYASDVFGTPIKRRFRWQADPYLNGSNFAAGRLNLLYSGDGVSTPAATGLAINADGTLTFAGAQAFPLSAGTGITYASNTISLNTSYTDGRYLQNTGGALTGALTGTTGTFSGKVTAGDLELPATGTANFTQGYSSFNLNMVASAYDATFGDQGVKDHMFRLQVQPVNNAEPGGTPSSARIAIQFAKALSNPSPVDTGFYIGSDGRLTFAAGQIYTGAVNSLTAGDSSITIGGTDDDPTVAVAALGVTTGKLGDLSVTTAKIADLNVTTGKLANAAVTGAKLGAGAVGNSNLADNSVTSAKIQDLAITNADVSNSAAISPGKISGTAATLSDANVFSANQTINGNLTLSGAINAGLRIIPDTTSGDNSSPSVVGGALLNAASSHGAFIGGGSATNPNLVTGSFGAVAGGESNEAGDHSVVGGGFDNAASNGSVVAGGYYNSATGSTSVVGGGGGNTASGSAATVPGGQSNVASGSFSFAAGWNATASHSQSFVWADGTATSSTGAQQFRARAQGGFYFVGGPSSESAGITVQNAGYFPSMVSGYFGPNGGSNSVTSGVNSAVIAGGGSNLGVNTVTDDYGFVGGGASNRAGDNAGGASDATHAVVVGGQGNTASGPWAGVLGGFSNTASGSRSAVGGGETNTASGLRAVISGGLGNSAGGEDANVGGGKGNSASTIYAAVGGGIFNTASGSYAVVSGGGANQATAQAAAVGGGEVNLATGTYATVPGGASNQASGTSSFAAGQRAKATHNGSFVWGDTTNADVNSSADNQFTIRANGGFRFLDSGNTERVTFSAAGTVTATAFVGDGSGLTGVSAGTANDLNCVGCVAASEVSFNYAGSSSAGGAATNAELLDGLDSTAFVQLSASNSFSGLNTFTATPSGAAVGQGALYLNPATAAANTTLLGLAVAGAEKLRIDAEGDITARSAAFSGSVAVAVDGTASSSGVSTGVKGTSGSTSGTGVRGDATASTGSTFGVHGVNSSDSGIGVLGVNNHAGSATAYGVKGTLLGTAGAAVFASASNPSGTSYGLHAESVSSSSVPGRFDLKANSGTILLARSGSPSLSDRFSVAADGSVTSAGTVTATSFSGSGAGLTGVATSAQLAAAEAKLAVRGINYIAGCDSCSLLTTSDSQKTIYVNVVGAMNINEVRCYSDTGTPTINLQRDGSVNTILSADLSCSASGGTTTSFTGGESTLNVNDRVDFYVTGGTGAAHRVTVVIKATVI